jgi:antitoxin component YwqK of YwqJK toxin-antitoxin module
VNDIANGPIILYNEKGVKTQEATYKDGVIQGDVTHYAEDGRRITEILPYVDGKITGQVVRKDEFGNLAASLDFKDGMFQGTGTGYYENGNPKFTLEAVNGKDATNTLKFDENTGSLVLDNLTGKLTVYNPDGSKSREITYKNGELNGLIRTYYAKLNQVNEEQMVVDGYLEGKYQAFDRDGNLMIDAVYHNDLLDGNVNMYDGRGHITTTIPYVKGLVEGEAVGYYPDGAKLFSAPFKNNKIEGWRKMYHANGKVYQEKLYKNGAWDGKNFREYDDEGDKRIELSEENYRQKALKFDDNGEPTDMSEEEIEELYNRIDTRKYEKEMMEQYWDVQKSVGSFLQGTY